MYSHAKRILKDIWPVFAFFLLLYVLLFARRVLMDIPSQMYTLQQVCKGEVAMPPTALFYVMGWIGALGQCQSKVMLGMGAALSCAGLLTARWWITRRILGAYLGDDQQRRWGMLAFALGMVCSLPTLDWPIKGWYIIGQPSPNYWMNGTLLASWPFALFLFWQSYQQLLRPEARYWRWMLLWLLLLLVSKPSYAFVFVSVYPLFLLGRHGWTKAVRWHVVPFMVMALLLVLESYLIFWQKDSVYVKQFNHGQPSGVTICLGCVWRVFSPNIPVSVLAAIVFPLGVAIAYWKEVRQKLLFWYAWAGFGAAIAISALFAQTGEEYTCWNFRWQTYIAAYILFMVSAMLGWEQSRVGGFVWDKRTKTLVALFLLHVLSGVGYLAKMFWTMSHY